MSDEPEIAPAPAIPEPRITPNVGGGIPEAEVERITRRDPSQYQWTYKRYTLRPPGSGEINPYERREWAKRPA